MRKRQAKRSKLAGGEDELHALFRAAWRPRPGIVGPGDDCARLRPPPGRALLWTTDQLALGIHARSGTSPELLACKLLRRSLSDLAAAGAEPWAVSWTFAAPRATPLAWLRRLARAFLTEAEHFGLPVVGGDCSTARALVLSCSILGLESRRGTPGRGGAQAGDLLFVTGRLGGAVQSGRHLLPRPRLQEGARLAAEYRATAMMDLSDGLARDLPRLLARSRTGARVLLEQIPLSADVQGRPDAVGRALGEGEDYELLVALRPAQAARAARDPLLRRCGLTPIGAVTRARNLVWLQDGKPARIRARGYEHRWS